MTIFQTFWTGPPFRADLLLGRTSFSGMFKVVLSKRPFRDQPYFQVNPCIIIFLISPTPTAHDDAARGQDELYLKCGWCLDILTWRIRRWKDSTSSADFHGRSTLRRPGWSAGALRCQRVGRNRRLCSAQSAGRCKFKLWKPYPKIYGIVAFSFSIPVFDWWFEIASPSFMSSVFWLRFVEHRIVLYFREDSRHVLPRSTHPL